MATLYVVGIGPGGQEHLSSKARSVIQRCPIIAGYRYYLDLLGDMIVGKIQISTGMTGEVERCQQAIEAVRQGQDVCLVSTGDPGLYGMAGLALELADDIDVDIVPGISAAFCAAAEVGAPLMHDMCTISLSDLLTPWQVIANRLKHAALGDFVIALYNPKSKGRPSHLERAVHILRAHRSGDTPAALVKNAGRAGNEQYLATLATLPCELADMRSIVLIGNSQTYIKAGKMVTPRGYAL